MNAMDQSKVPQIRASADPKKRSLNSEIVFGRLAFNDMRCLGPKIGVLNLNNNRHF